MKQRILFVIHYLELGGAERALLGLLQSLDYERYDVDLFVYSHRGELMDFIPSKVNLLPEIGSYAAIEEPVGVALMKGHIGVVAARLLAKAKYRAYVRKRHPREISAVFQYVADCVTPLLPSLKKYGEYDVAVSFLTPHNIVRDKVNARRKVAWIHTDYSTIDVEVSRELPVWSSYDRIHAVSETVRTGFLKRFPTLADKTDVFENVVSEELVRQQSSEGLEAALQEMATDGIKLLSVGRFTYAKNYDNVPFICRRLVQNGYKFKWFLIGFGGDEDLIRRNIQKAGMQDVCIILGKKANPYPYMAACDIYVQPSRFEGKAVTVQEAQILGKPVVVADYPTARSQVKDGIDGHIVPQDNEGLAKGLAKIIREVSEKS